LFLISKTCTILLNMLVDEVSITVRSGNGGDGAVAFNKILMSLGPVGGAGGRGGDVYLEGVSDIGALRQFRSKKDFAAQDGEFGRGQFRDGANGEDLMVKVPVGTVARIKETGEENEITKEGEKILIAKGGRGGKGNFQFRSSTNTSPKEFERGSKGVKYHLSLELKLIADVGLVGLPNAGKSTFLNLFTRASSKVADYPFTTLEPHLGAYYNLVLADIPGLIEGASEGKGLGSKFLRHIERTRAIIHLVSFENEDVWGAYQTIRKELLAHSPGLAEKLEHVFLTKRDLVDEKTAEKTVKDFAKKKVVAEAVTFYDDSDIKKVEAFLNKLENEKNSA